MAREKTDPNQDDLRQIIVWLGQRFAELSSEFVPRLAKAVVSTDKKVSFSATVTMQYNEQGIVECFLVPKAPKIPTEDLEPMPFICTLGDKGQLCFEFDGDVPGLKAALERKTAEPPPLTPAEIAEDAYKPDDGAALSDDNRRAAFLAEHPESTPV